MFPSLEDVEGLDALVLHANTITDGWAAISVLLAISAIAYVSTSRWGMEVSVTFALFAASVSAFLMAAMGMVGVNVASALALLLVLSALYLFTRQQGSAY